jgi:hypothetical protein
MTTCADPADDVCAVPKPAVPDTGRITDEVLDIVGEHCRRAGLASCTSDLRAQCTATSSHACGSSKQCARGVSAACSRLVQMDDRREEQTLTPKERIAALLTWCDPTDRDANADACAQVVGHRGRDGRRTSSGRRKSHTRHWSMPSRGPAHTRK